MKAIEVAAGTLCAARMPQLARRRFRGRLAILMYHGVEPRTPSATCGHVNTLASFQRQLDYLRRHFNVLPLEEALEQLEAGTLPDRAVTLTFDDGTRNLVTCVVPELHRRGMPGAFFLATGAVGTGDLLWPDRLWLSLARSASSAVDLSAIGLGVRALSHSNDRARTYRDVVEFMKDLPDAVRETRLIAMIRALGPLHDADRGPFEMMSWREARELVADGNVTIHPHTVTHPVLSRCSDEKIAYEVSESCAEVERQTGSVAKVFAYPNGRLKDFDNRAKDVLRARGVRWGLTTVFGFASRNSDPLALPRIGIASGLSLAQFHLRVSGALGMPH